MISRIRAIYRHKGWTINERPFELNLLGLRAKSTVANRFDDEFFVLWRNEKGNWETAIFPCTTDPGTYWLENPMQPQGTAILKEGQYRNAYQIGLHQGKYPAITQKSPVSVIRDYDRNHLLDFANGNVATGNFGINIHRASTNGTSKTVDMHSAGCTVLANAEDFKQLMAMADRHRKLYGNSFTYSLFDFRSLRRETLRRAVVGSTALLAIGGLALAMANPEKAKSLLGQIYDSIDHEK